jgi:NAD-dependent dihydropyrimidine dehydrogenase PreA subunit
LSSRVAPWITLGCLASSVTAQEKPRYPPPELGPDYVEPVTLFPALRELLPPLADVGVLVFAIVLASYLAHRRRSRTGLLLLTIASLIWFGFVREGCVCPVGSLQNVAEAIADSTAPILPATILFFVVPLFAALLTGRTFCAAVCPLGAIQEVVLLRPTRVPAWLAAGLGILPRVYLALAVLYAVTGSAYVICRYDPFVGLFRMGATANMLVVGGCLVFISVFIGRPYCRFLCPYGVLLGWASKISRRGITISPDACAKCRLCEATCPYDAITEPNEATVAANRFRGRGALIAMLALAPIIILGVGWSGARLGPDLARGNARVALAEQIAAEEAGVVRETTDASDVFRASSETIESLYADADAHRADFVLGGWLGGGFVGLLIALKLIALSVRRTRREYEADSQDCLACGRCFDWCPVEQERRTTGIVPEVRT